MMGLDVTYQVQVTPARLQRIKTLGRQVSQTVADLITFYGSFDLDQWGMEGAALHDPCVIAYLLDENIFTLKHVNVVVETNDGLTLGETVADWRFVTDRPLNCHVAYQADDERFFELLIDRLLNLP